MKNLQVDNLEKVSGGYRGIDEDEFVQISATYLGKKDEAMSAMSAALNSFDGGGKFVIAMVSCIDSKVEIMARLKDDKTRNANMGELLKEYLGAKNWVGINVILHDY